MAGDIAARMRDLADAGMREVELISQRGGVVSLADELPGSDLLDTAGMSEAFHRALGGVSDAAYLEVLRDGDPQLREQLARLTQQRGLDVSPTDLIVTAGSQQGLDLLVTALVDPGDVVVVERLCNPAARRLFELAGATLVPVACDQNGLDPDALERAVADWRPKLIYTMPTFHNPTGTTLDAQRREWVASVARREEVWVIEDDPYSELRYSSGVPDPLASYEPDRVVYLSTLASLLAPGLRVGWIAANAELRSALSTLKAARDMQPSVLEQRAAAVYTAADEFPAHLQRLQDACYERLEAMSELLPTTLGTEASWNQPHGGLFVWAELSSEIDTVELLRRAADEGVAFSPGPIFDREGGYHNALRLSLAGASVPQIGDALRRVGSLLKPPRSADEGVTRSRDETHTPSRTTMTRSLSGVSGVTSSVSSNIGGTRSITVPRRNRRR